MVAPSSEQPPRPGLVIVTIIIASVCITTMITSSSNSSNRTPWKTSVTIHWTVEMLNCRTLSKAHAKKYVHISSIISLLKYFKDISTQKAFSIKLTNPPSICCLLWLENREMRSKRAESPRQGTAAGEDCRSPLRQCWVTKLNLMKCGSKYTWVVWDKRETAASFIDTTKYAIMVIMLFLNE